MSSLTARLRFLLANPQPVPLLAAALSLGVVVMQLMLLPAQETLEEETGAAIVRTERLIRRAQIEGRERALQPAEQRQQLLEHFPAEAARNETLGQLLDLATQQGLQIPLGDYRLIKGKEDALFDRYLLNLPLKGSYGQLRQYLRSVRREHPTIAIEDFSLRRDTIGNAEVEAQLRFVIFCRARGQEHKP